MFVITDNSNYMLSDYFGIAFGFILRPGSHRYRYTKQDTIRRSISRLARGLYTIAIVLSMDC